MRPEEDVTALLVAWGQGDRAADSRLRAVGSEALQRVARKRLRAERPDHSVAATALVYEAYLRLVDRRRVRWQNRAHFFAIAARVMRQLLVDHARSHLAAKRGGTGWKMQPSRRSRCHDVRAVSVMCCVRLLIGPLAQLAK